MPQFSSISAARLATCDQRLQDLLNKLILTEDFAVICGHRDQAAQDQAFHDGFSKLQWPNGPHNSLPSLAVDLMPCPIDWNDAAGIRAFAEKVKAAAVEAGLDLDYGGDWTHGFVDNDHYQVKALSC